MRQFEISERLRRICSQFQTDALLGDEMTISSLMSWSIFIDLRPRSWDKFSAFQAREIPKQSRTRTITAIIFVLTYLEECLCQLLKTIILNKCASFGRPRVLAAPNDSLN